MRGCTVIELPKKYGCIAFQAVTGWIKSTQAQVFLPGDCRFEENPPNIQPGTTPPGSCNLPIRKSRSVRKVYTKVKIHLGPAAIANAKAWLRQSHTI
jgi:hypothetical protein